MGNDMSGRQDQSPADGPSFTGRLVLGAVMSAVGLLGVSALHSGVSLLLRPNQPNRIGAGFAALIGAVLVGLTLWYFYRAYVAGPRRAARLARVRSLHPGQPWMERPDWAARRVEHTGGIVAIGLWLWSAGWWGFLTFIGWVNYDKIVRAISDSWWNAALIAVFVGAGLLGLSFAIRSTLHWLRYGTSVLHITTLPAYAGETFAGALEARLEPLPRHPLEVELACEDIRWITSGHGKDRSTRAVVTPLGSSRSKIDPGQFVRTRSGVRAPIKIDVRAELPEYGLDAQGNGVRWVLKIATTGDDAPFSCTFDAPVFSRR